MTQIVTEIRINAPQAQVWAILADYGGVHKFSPSIRASRYTSTEKQGVGIRRHFDLTPMGSLQEEIVAWDEGNRYTSAVYDSRGVPPFQKAEGTMVLKPEGNQTVVTFTFDYALKFGVIGTLLNQLFLKRQFETGLPQVLVGLKHYCETGEAVSPEVVKRVLAQSVANVT